MHADHLFQIALTASEQRTRALMTQAAAGPTLVQTLREMIQNPLPEKRAIGPGAFRRDLTAGAASAGGYLAPTATTDLEQFILPYLLLRDGGLNFIAELDSSVTVPRCTTVPTASWLATEASTPAASDPVFGQVALNPKMLAIHINASRALILQANAEAVIGPLCGEAIARGIESAVFAGSGASGRPTGIINTAGIGTQSGTSLAEAGLRAMRKQVLDSGAREDRLTWLGGTDVQSLIGGREFSAGSGRMLWMDGKILGLPAIASTLVPAGTLILGDWSRCTVALFDRQGAAVEVNPFQNFQAGIVGFRLMIAADIMFSPAAAFSVANSIT